MNSFLKSIVHTALSGLALIAPLLIPIIQNNPKLDISISAVLAIILNWIISHSIPTTTGASARQN